MIRRAEYFLAFRKNDKNEWEADVRVAPERANPASGIRAGRSDEGRRSGCRGAVTGRGDRDREVENSDCSADEQWGDHKPWLFSYRRCGADQCNAQIATMRIVVAINLVEVYSQPPAA